MSTVGPDEPRGRILLRVPKSLHKQLVEKAGEEGVSLNQFLLYLIAMGLAEWSPKSVAYQKFRAAFRRSVKSGQIAGRR